jgi:hypothetical protein
MRKYLMLALVFAASGAVAAPANWQLVGSNTSGSTYEVDWNSLQRSGSTVTFWVRVKYAASTVQEGRADGYVALRKTDCSDRSYADAQTDYMKDGKLLERSGQEDKHFAQPGSIAAGVIDKVCS